MARKMERRKLGGGGGGGYNNMSKFKTSSDAYWMRAQKKNKRVHVDVEEEFDLGLAFTVHGAEGIDPPSRSSIPVSERIYDLVWWIEPGIENWAPISVPGKPNPEWNRIWKQRFGPQVWPGFIHLEVIRRRKDTDPGTSGGIETVLEPGDSGDIEMVVEPGTAGGIATVTHGIATVSRVKIPLPNLNQKKTGRFGLVKSDGSGLIAEGHIHVTMELIKLCPQLFK